MSATGTAASTSRKLADRGENLTTGAASITPRLRRRPNKASSLLRVLWLTPGLSKGRTSAPTAGSKHAGSANPPTSWAIATTIGGLILGVILMAAYSLSRQGVIALTSPGATIYLKTGGMSADEAKDFVDAVEAAKNARYLSLRSDPKQASHSPLTRALRESIEGKD
jgi:hypothetical protein